VGHTFRRWEETIQGPAQKFDAQIYTLRSNLNFGEQEREAEFSMLKDVVKNLVHALTDKTQTEILANSPPLPHGFDNDMHVMTLGHKSGFHTRKHSLPPPMLDSYSQRQSVLPAI